jgi:hypothetical protein
LSDAAAQELEPGAYQNAPIGVQVLFAGYGYSTGNVLFDASLPVEGADATVHSVSVTYLRTMGLFGRAAKLDGQVVASAARFEGIVAGELRTRSPKGLGDPRVRLSVNLLGSPALHLPQFAKYRQRTIVGASVQVAMPLGQYDADRYINLGANRWATRTEVAMSHARGHWVVEVGAGAWFFTDNTQYVNDSTLSQRALSFVKGSAIYSFKRNLWASASYGYANGGETLLNGVIQNNLQRNNRVGATVALPLTRAGALRVVFTSGLTTRQGADFDTVAVGYQHSWAPRPRSVK